MISKTLKTENPNEYVGAYAPAKVGDVSKAVEKIGKFDKFGSVLGLERVSELLHRLGSPQKDLKIIHIAGTNGKGSVSRFIYSVLMEAGYKVGIYSSPYLEVFNERIEAGGKYITDDELEKYADQASKIAQEMCDEGLLSPTEFDVVTAIAFMYFKEKNVDFVVLEVGLGGRGDSTNVIDNPLVSIITSISYDHMDRLGSTLTEIAGEKAGIIKNAPVILGIMDDKAKKVIRKIAAYNNVPIIEIDKNDYNIIEENLEYSRFSCKIFNKTWENLKIQMIGEHQVQNALVALWCLEILRNGKLFNEIYKDDINCESIINTDVKITDDNMIEGMYKAQNPGRFEVISKNPYIILDGAHNQGGIEGLVKTLIENFKEKKLLIVTGMLKDKDVNHMTQCYKKLNGDFIATEPNNPRKMAKEDLANLLSSQGLNVVGTYTPQNAKVYVDQLIGGRENPYDGIIFAGSLYLIGEIRRLLHDN